MHNQQTEDGLESRGWATATGVKSTAVEHSSELTFGRIVGTIH